MIPGNTLSIGFHNIQGLHEKNVCKINEIKEEQSNDIEIFVETWGCNCELKFEDYTSDYVSPHKRVGVKKGRASGGFMVLVKNSLSQKVNIIKKSNNFVWIEIDGKLIKKMDGNFFIVGTYIPDITSKYYDESIFDELFSDILKFSKENTPIGCIGDFNGRIGDLDDNYEDSDQINQHIPTPNTFSDIPKRKNCDHLHNSHGEKIIKFCKTYDFKILNGRMKGDAIGNFTHLNANSGTSTIDYGLCNQYLYSSVENFIILPINELSDHSKLTTIFKCNLPPETNVDKYKWKKLKSRFKWDSVNKDKFVNCLRASDKEIEEISQRLDAGLIESTGRRIQDLFLNAAEKSLKQKATKILKNWKKRKKSKMWFDRECCDLKKDLRRVGRKKHENPCESVLRTRYHEKLKDFKKMCRSKRNQFWEKTLEEVENSLGDPNTFWKNWKNANEIVTPTLKPDITGEKWYSHFLNLHTKKAKNK